MAPNNPTPAAHQSGSLRSRVVAFTVDANHWIGAVIQWFKRGTHLWGFIGAPILAPLVLYIILPMFQPEQRIRFAGLILELAGLFIVGRELARAQQSFSGRKAGTLGVLKGVLSDYATSFPRWPRVHDVVITEVISAKAGTSVGGSVAAAVAAENTLEWRMKQLEDLRKADRAEIDETRRDLTKLKNETKDALSQEQQERQKIADQQREFLRELATGGLAAQAMGWGWLVSGLLLSTLSQELADTLQCLGIG